MHHLSEEALFEYLDGRASALARRTAEEHCARCAACRRRAAFHRSLQREAAHPATGLLTDGFTERVMRASGAPVRASRLSWLLHNGASVIAMIVVLGILGVVGYYASQSGDAGGLADDSQYVRVMSFWKDASSSMLSTLVRTSDETVVPVVTETGKLFGNVFWMGAAALLLLGLGDALRMKFTATR